MPSVVRVAGLASPDGWLASPDTPHDLNRRALRHRVSSNEVSTTTAAVSTTEALLDARNRELAGTITLQINWLRDRAAQLRQQADDKFRGNNIALAYRLLGQSDEALHLASTRQG